MKFLWMIGVFFIVLNGFQTIDNERIPWEASRKLIWEDFKGEPDTSVQFAAITASGISHEISGSIRNGVVSANSKIVCYFHPQNSWYKKELASENLLAHEQLHFDIAELHARKLRKMVKGFSFTKNLKREMDSMYKLVNKRMKEFQKLYDVQTNYSQDKEKQQIWQQKVQRELLSMKNYAR